MPRPRSWWLVAGLVLVAGLAGWLRTVGLGFGLPAVYNPDEVAIMSRALAFATGDLNPHNFLYPTFYFYVLFAWVGAWFVLSWATGAVPSLAAFQTQFFVDPSGVYLAGRWLGVVCGVGGVLLTFLLGRRWFGARAGMAAALFLAISPIHVRDSHYVKHDVPATLAILAAFIAIARVAGLASSSTMEPATPAGPGFSPAFRRAVLIAGAACGVAFSTHYYSIFLALPLASAVVMAARERGWPVVVRGWLHAGGAAAFVFFALSPFLLAEPHTAWQDIVANRQIVVDRAVAGSRGLFASLPTYADLLWREGFGWAVVVCAGLGLVVMGRERPRVLLLIGSFALPFLAFIANTVAASRYLNPVLPFVALLAGYAVTRVAGSPAIGWGLMVALAIPGAWHSWRMARFFEQADTRTLAQSALERTAPAGSTVLVQPYSVMLTQSRDGLVEALTASLGDPRRASTKFALRLALDPYPSPAYRTLFLGAGGLDADKIYVDYADLAGEAGLARLRRLGVQYVVLKRYNVEDPAVVPLRAMLAAHGRRLAAFSPYRPETGDAVRARVAPFLHNTDTPWDPALERPGPGIEIWTLPL
jgi:hypothetical protein